MTDVIISPSSQTANQYAGGGTGVEDSEHRHMRDIAPLIHDLLQHNGVDSQILWSTDLGVRVYQSNTIMPKLHFALHSNASGTSYGAGTYIYQRGTLSEVMANKVQARLAALTPWPDNGVIRMDHYETRATKAYAVIAEVAYHDKIIPAEWIRTHKREIAIACAQGIIDALAAAYGGKYADIAARPLMLDGGGGLSPVVIAPTAPTYSVDYIKQIQRLLNEVDNAGLLVDGILGPITVSAVAEYQTVAGLVVDGDPGPITLSALTTATEEDDMPTVEEIWAHGDALQQIKWAREAAGSARDAAKIAVHQVAALSAAVDALATANGADPAAIQQAVESAVRDALARIEISVGE